MWAYTKYIFKYPNIHIKDFFGQHIIIFVLARNPLIRKLGIEVDPYLNHVGNHHGQHAQWEPQNVEER